ncbi:spore coat associated protein CotJA [Anaerotignum sp.]
MKEMCRNFVCDTGRCPQQSADTQRSMAATPAALIPDTSMGDCNACVIARVGLAQAMVPFQPYEAPMEQEQSLVCGTAFADLSMPYCSGWNLYRFGRED